ncbi:MAG: HAMP domain-containing sensor histidine kinase [Hyphomicrobium sp.]
MVGATSATRRQSYVLAAALASSQRQIGTALVMLGKGDLVRGFAAAIALMLSVIGVLVPHLDGEMLSALLFISGASLAFFAASGAFGQGGETYDDTAASPCKETHMPNLGPCLSPALRVRPLQRTLGELLNLTDVRSATDAAQWTRLTHRMSHELRTPLNAVIGFSDLMTTEVFGPLGAPQYRDYAANINKSGRILLKSAEDALAITTLLTRSPLKAHDPVASVDGAVADMQVFHQTELAGLGPAMTWDTCPKLDIVGESQTLRQILINLMAEAIDHAAPGSRLAVASSATDDEIRISLTLEGPGANKAGGEESFSLMLARTLLQLSQARLEEEGGDERWQATAIFPRAVQRDFFGTC